MLKDATKTRLDAAKTASKKVVHKTAEATRKLIRNKIAVTIVKPKPVPFENSVHVKKVLWNWALQNI